MIIDLLKFLVTYDIRAIFIIGVNIVNAPFYRKAVHWFIGMNDLHCFTEKGALLHRNTQLTDYIEKWTPDLLWIHEIGRGIGKVSRLPRW